MPEKIVQTAGGFCEEPQASRSRGSESPSPPPISTLSSTFCTAGYRALVELPIPLFVGFDQAIRQRSDTHSVLQLKLSLFFKRHEKGASPGVTPHKGTRILPYIPRSRLEPVRVSG